MTFFYLSSKHALSHPWHTTMKSGQHPTGRANKHLPLGMLDQIHKSFRRCFHIIYRWERLNSTTSIIRRVLKKRGINGRWHNGTHPDIAVVERLYFLAQTFRKTTNREFR